MIRPWIPALIALAPWSAPAQDPSAEAETLPLPSLPGIEAEIARLDEAHGDLVRRHRLGTTREGRSLEALELAVADHEPDWPALLVVANLEGPRVFESAVALRHVERLAAGWRDGDERVRALLSSTVVYVVPCANPDGAARRDLEPRAERPFGGHGVDDDRDGRQGEDPPADVDGDGRITWMRVPDPDGEWRADEHDPRVLVKADRDKGERGVWKLYREGRDADGDERVAEDAPANTRLNRNFPAGWQEHTADSGLFPSDEPECRALMEFVLQHPSVQLVLTYDGLDDLVEKPRTVADDARAVKRVPPPGVLASDAALIEELGRRYREATESEVEGTGELEGSFQLWCYDHRGLWSLYARLWELPEADAEARPADDEEPASEEGESAEKPAGAKGGRDQKKGDGPSEEVRRLAWIDAHPEEAWRFVSWTPYDHPELGAVEIGGLAPFAELDPPAAERVSLADRQLDFLLGLGAVLPRVSIAECTVEALGAGVWRVKAVLENDGLLPLFSRSMRRTRTTRPARVRLLLPEAARLLAGRRRSLLWDLPGSGGRKEFSWLVQGPEGMELAVGVDTDHAGHARRTAEVVQ